MRNLLLGVLLFTGALGYGQQNWTEFITPERAYGQILSECERLFDGIGTGRGTGYKQYRRWKYIMDGRASRDEPMRNYPQIHLEQFDRIRGLVSGGRATTGEWSNIGPFDQYGSDTWSSGGMGRVTCTAFHPTNTNIFWVGTAAGGVWKTIDGGITWSPLTDAFASIGITSILVHPTNPNILYILTGDGNAYNCSSIGVLKTINGGLTWDTTGLTFSASELKYGYKLIGHPTNPDIMFVGLSGQGLYRSANGGATFIQEIGVDTTVWDIEFIPNDPNQILVATNHGLMRSINGGLHWIVDNDPGFPMTYERMAIAISPSAPQNVYVVFGGDTNIDGMFRGCFKSADFGASFQLQSNTPNILGWALEGNDDEDQAWRDLSIIVDPLNDLRLYVGGVNIWESEDGGITWGRETYWTHNFEPLDPFVHADQQNFYWQGTTLFANNDGGIYKSTDYGNDWTDLSEGLAIGQFYEIDILNDQYMGGLQDNGTMEGQMSNPQSHQIGGGDGFGCTWHTGDNSIQYISTQSSIARRQFGSNVFIWTDPDQFWFTEIEMHKTNPDFFFLKRNSDVFRAHQDGPIWNFDWEDLNTDSILGTDVRAFSQCTSQPEVMYVISQGGIIKTVNLSAPVPDWVLLPNPVTGMSSVSDIIVDPNNPNRVWVTADQYEEGVKVFYSNTGGVSWINISGSIANIPIRCIEYASGSNAGVYIGTEIGMYFRGDAMSDWVSFANYLPNAIVMDIEISNGFVYAGTHGRGIWRSPLYTPCPSTLNLTQENDPGNPFSVGTQYYYAASVISSTRIIPGTMGNEIFYSAGQRTDLLPGFRGDAGSFVEIKVDGCPD